MADWWRDAVIYQIYPRSYQDSNGNGIGDLRGITARLPYVAGLGVDAIWLSPIFTSPMKDMGYDVSDYCDIDPLFGNLADFDTMVARAHELGLKVIIDQVLSHTSDKHAWFAQSRQNRTNDKADWYVWAEPNPDGTPPNNWPSVFGGSAWEWEPRRRQYYLHNFLIEQPDLNFHNPDVQQATLDNMRFWLDRGVDGFRLDTVNYYFHDRALTDNPPNPDHTGPETYGFQHHVNSKNQAENIVFLERLRALTDQYDARMMVGEVGDAGETAIKLMADYTHGPGRLHMCYSFEMLSPEFTAAHFRHTIAGVLHAGETAHPCWSFSNHDVMRHVSRWADHGVSPDALARQAIMMLISFQGTIGIYQGEELGQTETTLTYDELTDPPALRFWPEVKGRDGCRTPMVWDASAPHAGFTDGTPWLPVKPDQAARAVNTQDAPDSILNTYRVGLSFRKSVAALRVGQTEFIDLPEPVLAFHRIHDDQTITCLFNLSPTPTQVTIAGDCTLTGPCHATRTDHDLSLPANGYAFLTSILKPKITLS